MEQEKWLSDPANFAKWSENAISLSEKRVLATWWFGEAWEAFCSPKYRFIREAAFEESGCSIDLGGLGQRHLSIVGLKRPLQLPVLPLVWDDDAYSRRCWTEHPDFQFSCVKPPAAPAAGACAAAAAAAPASPQDCQGEESPDEAEVDPEEAAEHEGSSDSDSSSSSSSSSSSEGEE